jgi:hypothetical protein
LDDLYETAFPHNFNKLQELLQLSRLLVQRFQATFASRWAGCVCLPTFLVATVLKSSSPLLPTLYLVTVAVFILGSIVVFTVLHRWNGLSKLKHLPRKAGISKQYVFNNNETQIHYTQQ